MSIEAIFWVVLFADILIVWLSTSPKAKEWMPKWAQPLAFWILFLLLGLAEFSGQKELP